ncbi:MAG TPA: riboflavin biosynthesis protein RibF [Alloiococcus sp.]|nr:riboflavin biosynthesis protein RibF [Alloiococcus sp.]
MEIKKLHHPYDPKEIHVDDIVLILGFFDGVHRGHTEVISKGVELAKKHNLKSVVMTFNRHPSLVYQKYHPTRHAYLTTNKRKAKLIERLGVDILYQTEFTSKLGSLTPDEFVQQYMVDWHAKYVVAGYDYTYGKKELANMERLPILADGRFEVVTVTKKIDEVGKISSTRIRELISKGDVAGASKLLGYYYDTSGYVIHGEARGRTLGYPTANIEPHPYVFIPDVGIYAVKIKVGGQWYSGMASIGYNVTFGFRNNQSIEVHIFDFDETIYGEDVEIKWIEYLRDEKKFDSAKELVEQLDKDQSLSKKILSNVDETMIF